jgi:phosphomannomutase
MALKFGTSGVRGLVTEMTDEECFLYTTAFVRTLCARRPLDRVALSGDFRGSTPRIMAAVAAALRQEGLTVDYMGRIPTPALVHYAMARGMPSIMVTGSHIPDDRNGIKFNLPGGEVLKKDETEISANYHQLRAAKHVRTEPLRAAGPANEAAAREYVRRNTDFFSRNSLTGKRIVVYQHSAVSREMLPEMLSALGATVIPVGWSDTFVPVDTEAVAEPEKLAAWVREHEADALVSSDGDGDRPLVVDERGRVIRGDVLGVLVASALEADAVSAPVSCNTALEKCGRFQSVSRTRIGSPYVIEAMNRAKADSCNRIVGYEANGGFLTASDIAGTTDTVLTALPTRDCALPILAVLHAAASSGQPLSALVAELPPRYTFSDLIRGFPQEEGKELAAVFSKKEENLSRLFLEPIAGRIVARDSTDGARLTLENDDIVHFRPSGNAPEFRIYTEASTENRAEELNALTQTIVRDGLRPAMAANLAEEEKQKLANMVAISTAAAAGTGMDVVIVSTTSRRDEKYWQTRLESTRGEVCRETALVLAVEEDWEGGAGNGLGTLFAVQKACEKGRRLFGIDILERLDNGASVALYHTAGKGTRLAPLPASEGNNKPAVRLPGMLSLSDGTEAMTILEAAIRQTAIYAPSRKGRLSVFWGDQVFVPSQSSLYTPTHHADIMVQLRTMPGADAWKEEGLERYGLIAVDKDGDAAQVEKISYATANDLIDRKIIGVEGGLGMSIGSFSLSVDLLRGLIDEFSGELSARKGKLDTDPHFWMPLTLDEETYVSLMTAKGEDAAEATGHFERMQRFKLRFFSKERPQKGIMGAVDVGSSCYWWDYGTIGNYVGNLLKLVESGPEADAVRLFFGVRGGRAGSETGQALGIDDVSCVLGSKIGRGHIERSVLVNVETDYIDVKDSVLIGVTAPQVSGQDCLVYKVDSQEPLNLETRSVHVDVPLDLEDKVTMETSRDRDGKEDWNERLPGNPLSYAELHAKVGSLDKRQKGTTVR